MGICESPGNTLLERNLDTGIIMDNNLVFDEGDNQHQHSPVKLVRARGPNAKRLKADDLQNYFEKVSIEEFNRVVPVKFQDYARENPVLLPYEEDTSKLFEEEPVKLVNKNLYWGNWNEQYNLEGTGKMYLIEDNIFVEGIWKEGVLVYGRIQFPEGRVFEGEITDCQFNGNGKLIFPDGAIYEGVFSKGDREGRGSMMWPDGSKYWGEFSNDQLDGDGELFWSNGLYYRGQFKQNRLHGKGELSNGKKNKYHGEFANNMYYGKGKFIWEDNSAYCGNYLNGKKQGRGMYVIEKGLVFKGKFFDEKPHGPGELSTDSITYKGLWRNGELIEKGEVIKKAITDSTKNELSSEPDIGINMEFEVKKENINPVELKYLDQTVNDNAINFLPKEEDIRNSIGDFV